MVYNSDTGISSKAVEPQRNAILQIVSVFFTNDSRVRVESHHVIKHKLKYYVKLRPHHSIFLFQPFFRDFNALVKDIDHTPCIHTQVMNIVSPFGFLMNRTDRKQGGGNLSFAVLSRFIKNAIQNTNQEGYNFLLVIISNPLAGEFLCLETVPYSKS